MAKPLDTTRYIVRGGFVISTTASLATGRMVVAARVDDGASDDICNSPRQARALARALVQYADRAEQIEREIKKQSIAGRESAKKTAQKLRRSTLRKAATRIARSFEEG